MEPGCWKTPGEFEAYRRRLHCTGGLRVDKVSRSPSHQAVNYNCVKPVMHSGASLTAEDALSQPRVKHTLSSGLRLYQAQNDRAARRDAGGVPTSRLQNEPATLISSAHIEKGHGIRLPSAARAEHVNSTVPHSGRNMKFSFALYSANGLVASH